MRASFLLVAVASVLRAGATLQSNATVQTKPSYQYCGNETHPVSVYIVSTEKGKCTWTDQDGMSIQPDTLDNRGEYNSTSKTFTQSASVKPTRQELIGITYPRGYTDVLFTVTDSMGNENKCINQVYVNDDQEPAFKMPNGVNQSLICGKTFEVDSEPYKCSAYFQYYEPVATDNCAVSSVQKPAHNPKGDHYPVGSNVEKITAKDESGNEKICEIMIKVKDVEPPTLSCDNDIVAYVPATFSPCHNGAVVNFKCNAADNCNSKQPFQCSVNSGSTIAVGKHSITCTATDTGGNTTTATIKAKVLDVTPPRFKTFPSDMVHYAQAGESFGKTWDVPVAEDNTCDVVDVKEINGRKPGDLLAAGKHDITYVATDKSGNSVTKSFTLTVVSPSAPSISNCPGNITKTSDTHQWVTRVTWPDIVATDADNKTLTAKGIETLPVSGMAFPLGITTVKYTFEGTTSKQVATCEFNVIVNDVEKPSPVTSATDVFKCSPGSEGKGVGNYQQCGGLVIPVTSKTGQINVIGGVVPFSGTNTTCCNTAFKCTGDDKYKACLPK
uniref:HYR domain-containing protein n=1 Tax=Lotharella oceanica TaxID=641309 RepID=A0A7S2U3I6_9EUKA